MKLAPILCVALIIGSQLVSAQDTTASTSDPNSILVPALLAQNLPPTELFQILADDRPSWAWSNMYVYSGNDVVLRTSISTNPSLYNFKTVTNFFLIIALVMIGAFTIAANVMPFIPVIGKRYLALPEKERYIAVTHVIFLLTLIGTVVPQTYWVVHLLFGPHFSVQFNNTYQQLWAIAIVHLYLYVSEGVGRSVIRFNPFLTFHHMMYVVFFMSPMIHCSVWGSKLILMMDCFISLTEWPLYLALLTHRFVVSTRKVKWVTYTCLVWSLAFRILEAVVLISYFAGTYERMKQGGELWFWILFLVLALFGGFFACVMSYGIFIYYLIKRHRFPQLYGKSRYLNQDAVVNGQNGTMAAGEKAEVEAEPPLTWWQKLEAFSPNPPPRHSASFRSAV